jgi:hypothetical protein
MTHTTKSLLSSAWMKYYFALVGDQVPNSNCEIHLEPLPKKAVFKEYEYDIKQLQRDGCDIDSDTELF